MKLRTPQPLFLSLLTLALVTAGVGVRFGIPAYQKWSALKQLRQYADIGGTRRVGPEWPRGFVGPNCLDALDEYERIWFSQNPERFGRVHPSLAIGGWGRPSPPPRIVNDAVLACISNLPNLKEVDLRYTEISDVGMEHVCCLKKLESLAIDGTDVSDTSIPRLRRLPNLRELSLRGTRVSKAGVEELERAIPGLKVTR
jgi:hypothetical protein